MINELKRAVASWLLNITFDILPYGKFKNEFSKFLLENIKEL